MRALRVAVTAAAVAVITLVASNAVVATSVPQAPTAAYEGPGSASAEAAVSIYMNGLATSDLDAMVSSFAIETFVDHFDLRAYLEWIGVYSATATPLLVPAETPFTRALGIEERHGDVLDQIRYQHLALAAAEIDPTEAVNLADDATLDDFYSSLVAAVSTLDLAEVGSFAFVPLTEVDPAAAESYESEQNRANLDARRGVLGADELTDVVVHFAVTGQDLLAFFSVVRYGDAWWVEQLGGNFAALVGIPTLRAGATPIDEIG